MITKTRKLGVLTVRLTDRRTGAIHKINKRQWVTAGYLANLVANGRINIDDYTLEYKRAKVGP